MSKQMGYWVDLRSIKFDETSNETWIQGMPLGTYEHPIHGSIDITPERVQRFTDNVKERVRGTDLDVDYEHKAFSGEAAGWIRDAENRGADGLWLLVEWTKSAAEKIKNGAYRYFSPEFVDQWSHPKSGRKFADVLFGGGITNRPFLKDILPINMSELFDSEYEPTQERVANMDLTKIRELLGLSETATDEEILAAAAEKLVSSDPVEEPSVDGDQVEEVTDQEQLVLASEDLTAAKKLAEDNPAVAPLVALMEKQNEVLARTAAALKLSETEARVVKLSETSKDRTLSPAAKEDLNRILFEAPEGIAKQVYAFAESILKTGLVELGERGAAGTGSDVDVDAPATRAFNEAVTAARKENPDFTYADAVEHIASSEPKLFNEYREESFAFVE